MEHIGERIKIIRKMYNIKQKEFAEQRFQYQHHILAKSNLAKRFLQICF